ARRPLIRCLSCSGAKDAGGVVLIPPQVASSTTRADLSILQASDVSFGYRCRPSQPRALAVRNVSLAVPRGSFTGLLGPNGCGKTTLLKLLSGVLHPDSGRVTLSGRALSEMSSRLVASRIASVPQETHPAFDYTCMEMVLMGRHPHLGPFQLEGPGDIAIARGALAATAPAHLANRPYMTVSGGEKQRVVIAAALAQAGEVLLLDEPTASLDLGYQLEVALLLQKLNRDRGVTMVLATHDLNLAASLCDRLILMRDGRVVAQGAMRDVLTTSSIRRIYDVDAHIRRHCAV